MNRIPTRQESSESKWYCLRSKPKSEHIAAAHVRQLMDPVDVFCPRLRIRRPTSRGTIWFVEALFPGYLFARFDPRIAMQAVKSAPGIKAIVRFGTIAPAIDDKIIQELRNDFDKQDVHEVGELIEPGDAVTITAGPFKGFKADVLRVLCGARRVQVLLQVLGGFRSVELASNDVVLRKSILDFTPFTVMRAA